MHKDYLSNGKVRLTPDIDKILMCVFDNKSHSEAVVLQEEIKFFYEVNK